MQPVGTIPRLYSMFCLITRDLWLRFASCAAALRNWMMRAPLLMLGLRISRTLAGL
jgi:hypothetical protein